jgi:16S rRNA G966 N2-methylase RsmD
MEKPVSICLLAVALGFEAASRGAAQVTMIEQDAVAWGALQANAKTLQAARVRIVRGDALKFARSADQRFDVVFLDPPYRAGLDRADGTGCRTFSVREEWSMWKRNTRSKTSTD